MGEHLSGDKFAKVRVAFMRTDGLPSRVSYRYDAEERKMGNAERAVLALFLQGLHNLCDTCRHAMREMRIATEAAEKCERRRADGLCKDNSHPCSMKCARIADAINEYRKSVNDSSTTDANKGKEQ